MIEYLMTNLCLVSGPDYTFIALEGSNEIPLVYLYSSGGIRKAQRHPDDPPMRMTHKPAQT